MSAGALMSRRKSVPVLFVLKNDMFCLFGLKFIRLTVAFRAKVGVPTSASSVEAHMPLAVFFSLMLMAGLSPR